MAANLIRFGTRKGAIALVQTEEIGRRLPAAAPGLDVEIVKFETTGDSTSSASSCHMTARAAPSSLKSAARFYPVSCRPRCNRSRTCRAMRTHLGS